MEKVSETEHNMVPINYYENKCSSPLSKGESELSSIDNMFRPVGVVEFTHGGQMEAKLIGFRGGEGVFKLAQSSDGRAEYMILLDGMYEHAVC